MEKSLKDCPFCGGESDLWAKYGRHGYFAYCQCSVCSASSRTFSIGPELHDGWEDTHAAKRAVEAWNRRCGNAEQNH